MMNQNRRTLLAAALSAIGYATLGGMPAMAAESYPSKPVTVVVPYPAGGPADVATRFFTETMSKHLNQRIIVENVAGATGLIGAARVLRAPADGYTFLTGTSQEIIIGSLLNPAATFEPTDFQLIGPVHETNLVLLTKTDLPVGNLDEFIEYARASKQSLSFATVGIDSLYHMMGDAMGKRIGAEFLHVPYPGGAPALQALAGGQVDFAILPYQRSMEELVQQGRFKIMTTFSKRLPPPVKDLPTIDQNALLSDFVYTIPGGYYMRADTPEEVVKVLREAIAATVNDQNIRDRLEAEGRLVLEPMLDREQVAAYFAQLVETHRKLLINVGRTPLR